jgi:hypothetical protein
MGNFVNRETTALTSRAARVIPAQLVLVETGPVLADAGERESRID